MLYIQFDMSRSTYKRGGVYTNSRPSINDAPAYNIVTNNSDSNKYEERNGFRIYNSACLKVPDYDYKFCIVGDGAGCLVYFENNSAYYDGYWMSSASGKGLYTTSMTVQTINGVSFPYNEYLSVDSSKTNIIVNSEMPYFTDPAEYLAYITNPVSLNIVSNGGGATHIAKVTGQLKTLSNNLSDILMVSGGGGGGLLLGDSGWHGTEEDLIWSGNSNKMTVLKDGNDIKFKFYTNETAIYTVTSQLADVSKIYVSFLADSENQVMKPSFIYETASGVYSYNQEEPTDEQMGDLYTWLSAGLTSN